jgi:hypothetical protein
VIKQKRSKRTPSAVQELLDYLNKKRVFQVSFSYSTNTDMEAVKADRPKPLAVHTQQGIRDLITALHSWRSLPEGMKSTYLKSVNESLAKRRYRLELTEANGEVEMRLVGLRVEDPWSAEDQKQESELAEKMLETVFQLYQKGQLFRVRKCPMATKDAKKAAAKAEMAAKAGTPAKEIAKAAAKARKCRGWFYAKNDRGHYCQDRCRSAARAARTKLKGIGD